MGIMSAQITHGQKSALLYFASSIQCFGQVLSWTLNIGLFSRWLDIPVHQARNKRCLCGDSLKTANFYCLHEVEPFLKSYHIYGYSLPPCACARSKVIGSVVVVIIVNTKIA